MTDLRETEVASIEETTRSATVSALVSKRPGPVAERENFQIRRADTVLFATIDGLTKQSGVSRYELRRLALKELTDNGLDAADTAGRPGQVEIARLAPDRYRIADHGDGIAGTPEQLASLFAIGRPMVSGKFWRRPERGALGNGLRIVVGTVAATGGTIEVTTRGRRVLLCPKRDGHSEIVEDQPVESKDGTTIVLSWGPGLPEDNEDLAWAAAAIRLAPVAGPPYARRPSPHWLDAEHFAETLSIIQPTGTTVRQFLEQLDGCSGATAGRIAAKFGKARTCRDLNEREAEELLAAARGAAREIKPLALGPIGPDGFDKFDGYARKVGTFQHGDGHRARATIPFIIEAWVLVTDRKGGRVEIGVMANRTTVVDGDVRGWRRWSKDGLTITGGAWDAHVDVKPGDCSVMLHITSPLIPIVSIGKRPDLSVFRAEIVDAIRVAFNRSRDLLPPDPTQPKAPPTPKPEPKPAPAISVPLGRLGQAIEAEATKHGLSLDELTVLSPSLDPYRFDNAAGHRNGAWFAEQVARFVRDDADLHLRGLFYRIVAAANVRRPDTREPYTNTEPNWRWLKEDASKAARWLGYVPFDRIRDERNEPATLYGRDGEPVTSSSRGFAVGRDGVTVDVPDLTELLPRLSWTGDPSVRQSYRIAFIGEKSSLGEVLRPIARDVGAELLLSSGDCSETHIAEMATRAAADGRPLVVLYFSDFDPGGWSMPIAVARKFQAHRDLRFFDLNVQVHRVALTIEQVREFDLPSTPLKAKEKRGAAWRDKWGHDQTEIDALAALRPDLLRQITLDALRPFYDPTLVDRVTAATRVPADAVGWFESLPQYTNAISAIAAMHRLAEEAADALNQARDNHLDLLEAAVRNAAAAPKPPVVNILPTLTVTAPEPLFTTGDSFATACLKLIASKRLIDLDDAVDEP